MGISSLEQLTALHAGSPFFVSGHLYLFFKLRTTASVLLLAPILARMRETWFLVVE